MSGKKYTGPLPKSKPANSTNKKTGATRGAGDDAEYMRKAAEANRYKEGGNVLSDADRNRLNSLFGETGKSISDADRRRTQSLTGGMKESGKAISNADKKRVKKIVSGYEGGGAVRGMGKAYQGGKRSCKVR